MLQILREEGARLVTPELVAGEVLRWPADAYEGLVEELNRDISLDSFDRIVDSILNETPRYSPSIDALAAAGIHQALPLTRREAREPGIWRFLTVIYRPDFVRHRWENRSWSTMRSRFLRLDMRPDGNAIARLWWIAELTRRDTNYALTSKVLKRQTLANGLFVRDLAHFPPAIAACVEELEDAPAHVIEATLKELTRMLGLIVLESCDSARLQTLVRKARRSISSKESSR